MKKLTNKKGFTLIEMLVVIAIIAVLVAIIIPVVSSATTKAAAATDAANMRSLKAEIVTSYLSDGVGTGKLITKIEGSTVTIDATKYPAIKGFTTGDTTAVTIPDGTKGSAENWAITFDSTTKEFTVKFSNHTIADYATVAEYGVFTKPAA